MAGDISIGGSVSVTIRYFSKSDFKFTIDGNSFGGCTGMTWEQFISSGFNTNGSVTESNGYVIFDEKVILTGDEYLKTSDIVEKKSYTTEGIITEDGILKINAYSSEDSVLYVR